MYQVPNRSWCVVLPAGSPRLLRATYGASHTFVKHAVHPLRRGLPAFICFYGQGGAAPTKGPSGPRPGEEAGPGSSRSEGRGAYSRTRCRRAVDETESIVRI